MRQDSTHPTGVATDDGEKDDSSNVLTARQRKAEAALVKALDGDTWAEIAKEFGYPTARAAMVAVERTCANRLTTMDKTALRAFASMRLEALFKPVRPIAVDSTNPNFLAANKRAQEIIDRWIKLNGADAPQELVIYSPSEAEIDMWVAAASGQQAKELPEADIFEAGDDDYEWSEEQQA